MVRDKHECSNTIHKCVFTLYLLSLLACLFFVFSYIVTMIIIYNYNSSDKYKKTRIFLVVYMYRINMISICITRIRLLYRRLSRPKLYDIIWNVPRITIFTKSIHFNFYGSKFQTFLWQIYTHLFCANTYAYVKSLSNYEARAVALHGTWDENPTMSLLNILSE